MTQANGGILAIDLGTKTGWAARMPGGSVASGMQNFKLGRFDGNGMQFVRFSAWVKEMTVKTGCRSVAYEEVRRHKGVDAAHAYGGYMGHLQSTLNGTNVPFEGIPVGTIKGFWLGRGGGKGSGKEEMIAEAKRRGFNPVDDNEADALALLHYVENRDQRNVGVAA